MLYVIIAAIVVALGLVIWALVERNRASKAAARENEQRVRAEAEADARRKESAGYAAERGRLELVISQTRGEIEALERALAESRDPAAIRARLRDLLGGAP